jgi:hypothetical protein
MLGVENLLYSGDVWSYFELTRNQITSRKDFVVEKLIISYLQ